MPRAKGTNTRSDLLTPRLPSSVTAPDQAYGQRTAQTQSMKIVPPGAPPAPVAPAPPPQGGGTASAVAPAPGGAPTPAPAPLPGQLPWLHPTTHGLPVTHGMPTGPGAGPEALTGLAAQVHAQQSSEQGTLQQMLGSLAARPGASTAVKSLAANAGAQVA